MKYQNNVHFLIFSISILLFSACSTQPTPAATHTPQPTLIPTMRPSATPIPIHYVTLGSPFPKEWGTPLIWSNDSFNGQFDPKRIDNSHGHFDLSIPKGFSIFEKFDIDKHNGDVRAIVDGCVTMYDGGDVTLMGKRSYGLHLILPANTYPEGLLEALKFSGIQFPDLKKVGEIRIDIGHVKEIKRGCFNKGQPIAEIEPRDKGPSGTKLGIQVFVYYNNIEFVFSPTLFKLDEEWKCFPGSPYDCTPVPNDYAKK